LELVHFISHIHTWKLLILTSHNISCYNVTELVTTNVIYLDTGEETLMGVEMHVSLMTKVYKEVGQFNVFVNTTRSANK
jgi:hypothetical protein